MAYEDTEVSVSKSQDQSNVVMPYVVLRDGRTLAEHVQPKMAELMTMNPERLLGGSNG